MENLEKGVTLWLNFRSSTANNTNKSILLQQNWKCWIKQWVAKAVEWYGCDVPVWVVFQRNLKGFDNGDFPLRLVDAALHDGEEALLCGPYAHTLTISQILVGALLARQVEQCQCDIGLEVLLWCCTSYCKSDILEQCLRQISARMTISAQLYSSLLIRAIELEVVELVNILLFYGADANGLLNACATGMPPLLIALNLASKSSGLVPLICGPINDDIVAALFRYGAESVTDIGEGLIPLHCLTMIAIRTAGVAEKLIHQTPTSAYGRLTKPTFVLPGATPLGLAVCDVCMVRRSQRTARLVRMFSYALNPLLRVGAPMLPDFLEEDWPFFGEMAEIDMFTSKSIAIWGRPNVIANFVIEARRKTSLNVPALLASASKAAEAAPYVSAAAVCGFVNTVRSQYPRSLQSICRIAILNRLPVGVQRQAAIDSLNLPLCITNFLKYSEFNVLPRAIVNFLWTSKRSSMTGDNS